MSKLRGLITGAAARAAAAVALGIDETGRLALDRLRLVAQTSQGSLAAFSGTPCATAGAASTEVEGRPAARP